MSNYNRELAFNLRQRGLSEGEISSAIAEVHQHGRLSGEDPRVAFGAPAEYASRFPRRHRSGGGATVILRIGGLIGLALAVLQFVLLFTGTEASVFGLPLIVLAIPVILLTIGIAFVYQRRRPRQETTGKSK